jgi:transmembrane sensor
MDRVTERLQKLGEEVARISDASALPHETLGRVRRRLEQGSAIGRRRPPYRPVWILVPSVALALVAAMVIVVVRAPRGDQRAELMFSVDGEQQRAAEGEFVEANEEPVELRFSEGTRIEVMPDSGLHVLDGDSEHVRLLLARGSARLEVVHLPSRQWTVTAGPFLVRVTGTRFDLSWDPKARRFELNLSQGRVEVTGPHLPRGRPLVAGERLEVSAQTGQMTLSSGPAPAASNSIASQAAEPAPAADASTTPAPSSQPTAALPSWQQLARSGQYRAALLEVEEQGFGRVLGRSSAAELRLLADTARFGGQPRRARDALLALRKRFGARGETAFLLGKMEADQLGAPADALRWFETYLSEAPRGVLREQALGRSLELLRGIDQDRARTAAERYLKEYPGGAYASLARRLAEPGAAR